MSNSSPVQGEVAEIDRFIVHPQYAPAVADNHDIALVILKRPVSCSTPFVDTSPLNSVANVPDGTVLTALGFGFTSNPAQANAVPAQPSSVLRRLTLISAPPRAPPMLPGGTSEESCIAMDGEFCMRALRGADSCNGDSGGPLVEPRSGVLVGLTSRGPSECGAAPAYNVNTDVAYFKDWITQNVPAAQFIDHVWERTEAVAGVCGRDWSGDKYKSLTPPVVLTTNAASLASSGAPSTLLLLSLLLTALFLIWK